jgi:glutathione S-transferase
MALRIYGVARSRAFRTLWMAKELGLDYEHVKTDFATGDTRQPQFLALNPNGHIPVIDDDGFSPRSTASAGSIRAASKTRRGRGNGASGG